MAFVVLRCAGRQESGETNTQQRPDTQVTHPTFERSHWMTSSWADFPSSLLMRCAAASSFIWLRATMYTCVRV